MLINLHIYKDILTSINCVYKNIKLKYYFRIATREICEIIVWRKYKTLSIGVQKIVNYG